jgi:hypothetical protein
MPSCPDGMNVLGEKQKRKLFSNYLNKQFYLLSVLLISVHYQSVPLISVIVKNSISLMPGTTVSKLLYLLSVTIEMKGITRCKLTIMSESAVCKKFLGQIVSYPASL